MKLVHRLISLIQEMRGSNIFALCAVIRTNMRTSAPCATVFLAGARIDTAKIALLDSAKNMRRLMIGVQLHNAHASVWRRSLFHPRRNISRTTPSRE